MSRPLNLRERELLDAYLNDDAPGSVYFASPQVERPDPPLWREMLEVALLWMFAAGVVFGVCAYDALTELALDGIWPIDTSILTGTL